jgi:hypothetical protein
MSTGFENEDEIIYEFVTTTNYKDLNENLKRVVLTINNNKIPNTFNSKKYGGANKADLSIILDHKEYFISVKKGSGNSLHQESLEDFIAFLESDVEKNESVFEDLRYFIWGDGSLDGTAPINQRIPASLIKKKYPLKIENIQDYFNKHRMKLTNRFILDGSVSKNRAGFLLYGNITRCIVVEESKVMDFVNNTIKPPLSIGVLTFQAWNRNLTGIQNKEKRRGQIQLKWGTLEQDLKKIK